MQNERGQDSDGHQGQEEGAHEERHPEDPQLRLAARQLRVRTHERLLEDGGLLLHDEVEVRREEGRPDGDTRQHGVGAREVRAARLGRAALADEAEYARDDHRVDGDVDRHEDDVVHRLADDEPRALADGVVGRVVDNGHRHRAEDEDEVAECDVHQHGVETGAHPAIRHYVVDDKSVSDDCADRDREQQQRQEDSVLRRAKHPTASGIVAAVLRVVHNADVVILV